VVPAGSTAIVVAVTVEPEVVPVTITVSPTLIEANVGAVPLPRERNVVELVTSTVRGDVDVELPKARGVIVNEFVPTAVTVPKSTFPANPPGAPGPPPNRPPAAPMRTVFAVYGAEEPVVTTVRMSPFLIEEKDAVAPVPVRYVVAEVVATVSLPPRVVIVNPSALVAVTMPRSVGAVPTAPGPPPAAGTPAAAPVDADVDDPPENALAMPYAPPPTARSSTTAPTVRTRRRACHGGAAVGSTTYSRGPSPESITLPPVQNLLEHRCR
jgi:hypothetical protein